MPPVPRMLAMRGGKTVSGRFIDRNICFACLHRVHQLSLQELGSLNGRRRRHYANEASSGSSIEPSRSMASHSNLCWPTSNPNNPYDIPTPYEIFGMSRSESYSKRRFYDLVKLYHPDRAQLSVPSDPLSQSLTQAARLERYRMVIAANELLSDPRRRRAYDEHGVGWDGKPDFGPSRPRWAEANNRYWSGFDDNVNNSPRANATWEDWEQWYMRADRAKGEQREAFTSNGTFVAILVVAAGLATVGESIRMSGFNRTMLQQVEERHDVNSRELFRRREESQNIIARDDRTRRFLLVRGPVGTDVEIKAVGQEKEGSQFVNDDE